MFSNHDSARPHVRARRGRPDDRLAARQAIDADVQEAADDGAEQRRRRPARTRRSVMTTRTGSPSRCGSSGSGKSGDDCDSRTRPSASDLVRRAGRIDRNARKHAARGRAVAQSVGGLPAALRASIDAACSASISSSASQLQRAAARRRCRSQSISADCRMASHIVPRRLRDRPLAPASSPPATAATTARPAPRWPCRTTPPPGDSRGATSSGRTRCPACTPTYRVERAIPFSSSATARSGRPAPAG